MKPGARAQAAIELLDEIIAAATSGGAAADTIIARYFKTRRYAGSQDRRAVRDLVYAAIRRSGERPPSGRAALLGLAADQAEIELLFDGTSHAPEPPRSDEDVTGASLVPQWLVAKLDPLIGPAEWPALLERAPLDLRVNKLAGTVEQALAALPGATRTKLAPLGLRLAGASNVEETEAWRSGLVEVQDEGSQLLMHACGAAAGERVVDLCAGAGGKTLGLAADMADEGRILACDVDRARLQRIDLRLARAGVHIVEPRLLHPGREAEALSDWRGGADLVLVDAPCSGSGTWRRNPETRWRLTPARLAQLVALQARLLDLAVSLMRPGGRLIYAVCSLLPDEGRAQAEALGRRRSGLVSEPLPIPGGRAAGPGRLLTPGHDGTDGFFVARWRAPC